MSGDNSSWAGWGGGNASAPLDLAEITMNSSFALLLASLLSATLWLVYATYYHSRLVGYILTKIVNKFYFQDDNFKIGSFTLNALSGKIMFRDVVYINYDYTVRVQDGYLIFRWWRSYVPKDVSEDLSHSDTRLSIMLNGFELHLYNRCELYSELEKTFGLEATMKQRAEEGGAGDDSAMNHANEKRRRARDAVRSEAAMARTWRDLIPVIKADVCCGRVVFGNRLVPTSLSVAVEEAHLVYSTKPPASRLDHLMHFVKAKADNCKVLLAPSPNYTSLVDEPPRYMGEGFVVMSSNYMELYLYMDEPGLVPDQPVLLQLANGDVVESAPPIWGVDIKCGKGTDFSYGPWADRQREHLFKFFFPPSYKSLEVTPQPKPGDRRQMQSFDIRLSTLNEATIDILFTKNKETNAVHINIGAGSYLEVTLPWIVLQDGYTTKITGQLLHLEATTSLQYRSFIESETLEYTVKCHYPLVWNHHQCWQLALTGCKATAHLVYTHIDFFIDLINDWSSKSRPDILHFVPYTWKISLLLKECEVITISNEHNWIDCSSTNQENNHVAFCGDLLDVSFDLPFVDFLPDILPLKIWVQGEAVDMSLYLPEVNTSRLLLLSIDKNMKLVPCRLRASKWRRKCVKSQGWVDCWSVPIVALSVRYNYHPIPPLGPEPQADITTPEKEEILLSPMRIPRIRKTPQMSWPLDGSKLDRTALAADRVSVELEVGPSVLLAYGTIITSFINLVENIFGEDQTFTDMQKSPNLDSFYWPSDSSSKQNNKNSMNQHSDVSLDDSSDSSKGVFDPRYCRPLEVTVSIIIHDIQAHLVKNCSESEPPCPVIVIERFGFEMDKSFRETKLQLLLSPSILVSSNNLSRSNPHNSGSLYQGHLMLSSLQLRGHGFFSDANRSVDEDTIEYAWMMEIQLGQLTGRLSLPQLYHVVSSLETFVLLVSDSENELFPPNPAKDCHHGVNSNLCAETDLTLKYRCPTPNEIKYRMVRVAIDVIDVYLADVNTTLQTWISPIRLSFCNLHGPGFGSGVTLLLPNIKLALYTMTNMPSNTHHHSNGSNSSQSKVPEGENWVNVGSVSFGPLLIEAASSLPQSPKNLHLVQQKFLKVHDEKTKRLWFMWPAEGRTTQCGCTGGCAFFGSNRNGPNFFKPQASDIEEGINVAMFKVMETGGEYGYGQSVLQTGQLVFHTPPYSARAVLLAAPPEPKPRPARPITRRFSYTSLTRGSSNVLVSGSRSDVPYARLVDSTVTLANSKIDSDSKLNKSVLSVPQMESSISDSRLALSCAIKDTSNAASKKHAAPDNNDVFAVPKTLPRPVGVSDSHYSLNSQVPQDVPPEVQRTTSITSENHSEAFFSADEDMFPSRSSSLKHSFGSRHSATKEKSIFAAGDNNEKWMNSLPRSEEAVAPDTVSNLSIGAQPDSESGSVSSTSFISAISSQEDMTLVNLHMQTNKPIVDSPLLMSSYIQNLPQYKCTNWNTCSLPCGSEVFTLPLFQRTEDGTLLYVGQKYLPNFEASGKNFFYKLISKKESFNGPNQHSAYSNTSQHFNTTTKAHPFPPVWWELQQNDNQENSTDKNATSTTATTTGDTKDGVSVRLRGEVDVTMSPLVLESAQKLVESLTPVLANIHPVTVLTHLRLLCVSSVQRANVLKQKQHVLNWLPRLQAPPAAAAHDRCRLATIPHSNVYEETVSQHLQATLTVPKLNIIFIQSSVVEDMISFSALDNIQDLTCVSLFGVCLENIVAKYVSSKKSLESMQLYYRPTLRALANKKSFGIMKGPRAFISTQSSGHKTSPEQGEPVYIETSQQQCEDTTVMLNIGKVHCQLRRTRNESSQLKDATITGIPSKLSKVSFDFVKMDSTTETAFNGIEMGAEEGAGYMMLECGVEGVSVEVWRHSRAQQPGARPPPAPPSQPATPAPSPSEPRTPPAQPAQPDPGNASTCSIDLKVVWFNFAAPPRTPITRRIDYTRLDWNLLSTASPAINAWLNPCNRLAIRAVAMYRARARRLTATAASLMAAALDAGPRNLLPKSRYGRYTALARQLREEPALQLVSLLVRHAAAADAAALQADLADRHLPSLSTLRQGVIVLSRQWKNILYTPLLLEHNYKNKMMKPLNVTFALPELLEAEAGWGDADPLLALDEAARRHLPPQQPAAMPRAASLASLCSSGSDAPRRPPSEDLYQWMAKQEGGAADAADAAAARGGARAALPACSLYPVGGSLMLLDANLVFRPLLAALGVSPTQVARDEAGGGVAPALESLGSTLSLVAWVEAVRADIVVSEAGRPAQRHHRPEPAPDTPALLCEKLSLDIDMKKIADVAVDELVRRRNVLYISRGQLKRHISTMLHVTAGARFISQQVNMPLLRLLHQISGMYRNVKEAQHELRAQADSARRAAPRDPAWERRAEPRDWGAAPRVPPPRPPPPQPPPVTRPRPQSFAQKLRSTGKSVKGKLGYSSLNEGAHTPMFAAEAPAPPVVDAPAGDSGLPLAPHCWRTVYQLLDLYSNMPDADTITHRFSVSTEMGEAGGGRVLRGAGGGGGLGVVVVGVARIHRTRLLASLSGLKLEAEITSLQGSLSASRARPCSLSGTLARTAIVLLEGQAPDHQTVVRVGVGKSQALYSWEGGRAGASALLSVGGVRVDLPQHPVALHGVMTRSSRQLSSTLQELGVTRSSSRVSRSAGAGGEGSEEEGSPPPAPRPPPERAAPAPDPPQVQFSAAVASLSVAAALLPSLQAQYKMENVVCAGVTGAAARFTVELPQHWLSFVTVAGAGGEANIPAAAAVALPAVHVAARTLEARREAGPPGAGRYLAATADIGLFEHTLSTDLLNHLVFVQKVFMKEVNEVVQKVYGGEKPVPLWGEEEGGAAALRRLLFTLTVRIQRIQLTATTPSNSAVRLETGLVELEVSNLAAPRLRASARVLLNLSLGQLLRNAVFEEAEPEFQQYAFFKTRISMRNALEEDAGGAEVVAISLRRPLVYVQPVAVDRAILVWLNYKNAYEYWAEQRRSLNQEVLAATQQLMEKVALAPAPHGGTLFLQLDVDDVGLCVPLSGPARRDEERGAVVVTLQSTSVSACSSGALVSKGRFVGLCLRFATDFEASLDDWQPRPEESALNVCRVSEGTYEVCSRTAAARLNENAKWFLNVSWQMEGVDIHLDVSVGKQLSALGHTLTMLTGIEEEEDSGPSRLEDSSSLEEAGSGGSGERGARRVEQAMSEQARIISDLRALGASHSTIEHEIRRLHDLEALVFRDFRRDMLQRLRRHSVKASSLTRGKLGLGRPPAAPRPAPDPDPDDDDDRLADILEAASWSSVESDQLPANGGAQRGRGVRLEARPDSLHVQLRHNTNGSGAECGGKTKTEPNVDLELDVKVHVNSGQCVLHTKEPAPPAAPDHLKQRARVGRSASGGVGEGGASPGARRRAPPHHRHPAQDLTVFQVPGLDFKVHYESKTLAEEAGTADAPTAATAATAAGARRGGGKKAMLLAWITLHNIPEETLISPHILDFLEQALEPIPPKQYEPPSPAEEGGAEGYGEMVYASFPVDVVVHFFMQPATFRFSCLPASRVECLLRLPSLQIVFSSKRAVDPEEQEWEACSVARGGLSVTGVLADFSVYVFHPYGGKQPRDHHGQPRPDTDRKDSLSVNVEFVKFHLARSRKLDLQPDSDRPKATVRFSTIVDVGSAWFKYDMRRLGEILAFPKAWYRRTIVRRMFLGDLSLPPDQDPDPRAGAGAEGGGAAASPAARQPAQQQPDVEGGTGDESAAWETLVLFAVQFARLRVHMNMGNVMGNVHWSSRGLACPGRLAIRSEGSRNLLLALGLQGSQLDARGGIVGGAISLSDIYAYGHMSEEEAGRCPQHVSGVGAGAAELRLEYMGAPALVARVSRLAARAQHRWHHTRAPAVLAHATFKWGQLQMLMSRATTPDLLKMQLKLEEFFTAQFKSSKRVLSSLGGEPRRRKPAPPPPRAPAPAFAPHAHWGQLLARFALRLPHRELVVGGTMELHGAHVSLACFHGASFKAKSWALFSLKEPCLSFATEARQQEEGSCGVVVAQSLTASLGGCSPSGVVTHCSMATVCRVTRAVLFPPQFRTLHEWFQYAFANSEIDAIELFPTMESETASPGGPNTGGGAAPGSAAPGSSGGGKAHVREVIFALPSMQMHLRTTHRQVPESREAGEKSEAGETGEKSEAGETGEKSEAGETGEKSEAGETGEKSEAGETGEKSEAGEKSVVECSFITEFEDHIFVSVDAEAFLFLHDLISSYIHEKARFSAGVGQRTSGRSEGASQAGGAPAAAGGAPSAAPSAPAAPPAPVVTDPREYRCLTWHLEPTVRLLSWAGKSIEPYGVDYILQKLGFRHARSTIPKWVQRGALDPLDSALALALRTLADLLLLPHQPHHHHHHHQQ